MSLRGVFAAASAFALWGALVLYWDLLNGLSAFEILAHRIVWSLLCVWPLLLCTGRMHEVRAALHNKGTLLRICGSALLIGTNWCLYIYAVVTGHVLDASLGYYINPLSLALLGFVLLGERPARMQVLAIALAALGVVYSLVINGYIPWLAVSIALSFSLYGFIRKTVQLEAAPGVFLETALLTPFALAWLVWLYSQGQLAFGSHNLQTDLLLVGGGPVTLVPLLLFTYATRHITLITLGILQYLSPTITLLLGLFVLQVKLEASVLVTFVFIWLALGLYTWNAWRFLHRK